MIDSNNSYYIWVNASGTVGGVAHRIFCFDIRTGARVISFGNLATDGFSSVCCLFENPANLNEIWYAKYVNTEWIYAGYNKTTGAFLGTTTTIAPAVAGQAPYWSFRVPGLATHFFVRASNGSQLVRMTAPVVGVAPTTNVQAVDAGQTDAVASYGGKLLTSRTTATSAIRELSTDGLFTTVADTSLLGATNGISSIPGKTGSSQGLATLYPCPSDNSSVFAQPNGAEPGWLYKIDVVARTFTRIEAYAMDESNFSPLFNLPAAAAGNFPDHGTYHCPNPTDEYWIEASSGRQSFNYASSMVFWRLGIQRARWSYTPGATVLRGVLAPGAWGGAVATDTRYDNRPVYWYYSLNGGGVRVQFQPGDTMAVVVAAGQSVTIDADFRDPRGRYPGNYWIGGAAGEGISLLFGQG